LRRDDLPRARRAGRAILAWFCIAAAGAPSGAAAANPERRTNIELASETIRQAVREALQTFPEGTREVRLAGLGTSDANTLVESVLIEELAARGVHVEVASAEESAAAAAQAGSAGGDSGAGSDSAEAEESGMEPGIGSAGEPMLPGGAVEEAAEVEEPVEAVPFALLTYRVTDFSFRYADVYRKFYVGPKRIVRVAKIDLHLRLSEIGGDAIVWSKNTAHSASDVIPSGFATHAESTTYAFAKPERSPSTLTRLYEPLLVSAIVGGLVFLFYSNQSGD
jgi:hypothetical protein